MWLVLWIPKKYKKRIYNYLFKQQIYVLESSPMTLLKYSVLCSWRAPFDGQYKLNVSVFFKKNLGGTKEACCGEVLRDCRGRILEIFYKPFPDATSRDEVLLLGVLHGIDEILKRRLEAKDILLEVNHKKIVKVLNRENDIPIECLGLYHKIFGSLEFDKYEISFQYSQGNTVANRVAYIASHLTVGQSFPIGDRGFETEVRHDRLNIPRYEIIPKESSDEEFEVWF
ncbi:uncharacterized protein LOC132280233 isoform X4 [Cornus florida]|uniref:uncharacterized protein LOC132280233 isoform X4 n=1 Tax=Cornus florida TaxID=4283 RepID=UPI00289984E1|nr:uncharacterized protein LOC132280233 isoform X4 [Cornus florida]